MLSLEAHILLRTNIPNWCCEWLLIRKPYNVNQSAQNDFELSGRICELEEFIDMSTDYSCVDCKPPSGNRTRRPNVWSWTSQSPQGQTLLTCPHLEQATRLVCGWFDFDGWWVDLLVHWLFGLCIGLFMGFVWYSKLHWLALTHWRDAFEPVEAIQIAVWNREPCQAGTSW